MTLPACFKMTLRLVHALILSCDGQVCSGKNNTVWASFAKCVVVLMQPDSRSPLSTRFSWVFAYFLVAVLSIARGETGKSKVKDITFLKSYFCRLGNFLFRKLLKLASNAIGGVT